MYPIPECNVLPEPTIRMRGVEVAHVGRVAGIPTGTVSNAGDLLVLRVEGNNPNLEPLVALQNRPLLTYVTRQ
jgi:hypothetical protein